MEGMEATEAMEAMEAMEDGVAGAVAGEAMAGAAGNLMFVEFWPGQDEAQRIKFALKIIEKFCLLQSSMKYSCLKFDLDYFIKDFLET